jgi:hypothetical protein
MGCGFETSCNASGVEAALRREYPGWASRHSRTRSQLALSRKQSQFSGLASQRACLAALDALRQTSFEQYCWCLRLRASGWNFSLQHRHLRAVAALISRRKMHRQAPAPRLGFIRNFSSAPSTKKSAKKTQEEEF